MSKQQESLPYALWDFDGTHRSPAHTIPEAVVVGVVRLSVVAPIIVLAVMGLAVFPAAEVIIRLGWPKLAATWTIPTPAHHDIPYVVNTAFLIEHIDHLLRCFF
jgi:hypothetical protein